MDLFDFNNNEENAKPLAERMRANALDEFIGQEHIVAEGSLLRRAIATDRLGSCIFWGPPGCGKTTLANIIALRTNGEFIKLNAVNAGVADVKKAVEQARDNLKMFGKRTYLLLDECHRFNKTQSDSLLPAIEQGTIIFIGSTTENPYASMTPAIVSRCRVFEFKRLTKEDITGALKKAVKNRHKGLGKQGITVDEAAYEHIASMAGGDLRSAYNALELAALTTSPDGEGNVHITLADAEQSIQRKALSYNEDSFYDFLSAFCKSLRGSDANAALDRGRLRPDDRGEAFGGALCGGRRYGRSACVADCNVCDVCVGKDWISRGDDPAFRGDHIRLRGGEKQFRRDGDVCCESGRA